MNRPGDTKLQSLLDAAARGDSDAYSELINHSADRVQILTARMLRNYPQLRRWEETGDILQTALLKLYRSLSDVKPDSVRGYFGLAATQIRRTLIDLSRHHFGPMGAGCNHQSAVKNSAGGLDEPASHPSEAPETLQAWSEFHEAVEQLDPPGREVFELVWYQGLSQPEVSELLDVSVPTVKRRLRAARLALASQLYNTPHSSPRAPDEQ